MFGSSDKWKQLGLFWGPPSLTVHLPSYHHLCKNTITVACIFCCWNKCMLTYLITYLCKATQLEWEKNKKNISLTNFFSIWRLKYKAVTIRTKRRLIKFISNILFLLIVYGEGLTSFGLKSSPPPFSVV